MRGAVAVPATAAPVTAAPATAARVVVVAIRVVAVAVRVVAVAVRARVATAAHVVMAMPVTAATAATMRPTATRAEATRAVARMAGAVAAAGAANQTTTGATTRRAAEEAARPGRGRTSRRRRPRRPVALCRHAAGRGRPRARAVLRLARRDLARGAHRRAPGGEGSAHVVAGVAAFAGAAALARRARVHDGDCAALRRVLAATRRALERRGVLPPAAAGARAAPSPPPPLVCVGVDSDAHFRRVQASVFAELGTLASRAMGATAVEQAALVDVALGRRDLALRPVADDKRVHVDVALFNQRIELPGCRGAHLLGSDLTAQLHAEGFRGVACILTGEGDLAALRALPGVDLALPKAMRPAQIAAVLHEALLLGALSSAPRSREATRALAAAGALQDAGHRNAARQLVANLAGRARAAGAAATARACRAPWPPGLTGAVLALAHLSAAACAEGDNSVAPPAWPPALLPMVHLARLRVEQHASHPATTTEMTAERHAATPAGAAPDAGHTTEAVPRPRPRTRPAAGTLRGGDDVEGSGRARIDGRAAR